MYRECAEHIRFKRQQKEANISLSLRNLQKKRTDVFKMRRTHSILATIEPVCWNYLTNEMQQNNLDISFYSLYSELPLFISHSYFAFTAIIKHSKYSISINWDFFFTFLINFIVYDFNRFFYWTLNQTCIFNIHKYMIPFPNQIQIFFFQSIRLFIESYRYLHPSTK